MVTEFEATLRQAAMDLDALLAQATADDLATAREAVTLIEARGFNRDQSVVSDLERAIASMTGEA